MEDALTTVLTTYEQGIRNVPITFSNDQNKIALTEQISCIHKQFSSPLELKDKLKVSFFNLKILY